jgi:hypothetical protein
MKRDERLRALSGEHHHALVLARRATRGELSVDDLRRAFAEDLAPHFAIEETILLPALREAGHADLADRTAREHDEIGAALTRGEVSTFGRLLTEHVRFEERELFPACETTLATSVLDSVATPPR